MDKTSAVVEYNVNGAKAVGKQAVNSALSTVKDSVLTGVTKAQGALQGLDVAQDLLKGQQESPAKKVKKAQKKASKNVKNLQGAVQSGLSQTQDMLLAGLSTTQDAIDKNTKLASKNLKKAQKNITGTRSSLQNTLEKRARRRKRGRTIFRLGVLSGFILVLLYTPWPGSEIRSHLQQMWNEFSSSQQQ